MKKSVKFLPPKKRADLEQLVGLVRQHIKEVHMVILYGSYARNNYVDYDQRIEFGVPTYYMSDYDILILTRKEIGAIELSLYDKIKDAFFQHKVRIFTLIRSLSTTGSTTSTMPCAKLTISKPRSSERESFFTIRANTSWSVGAN